MQQAHSLLQQPSKLCRVWTPSILIVLFGIIQQPFRAFGSSNLFSDSCVQQFQILILRTTSIRSKSRECRRKCGLFQRPSQTADSKPRKETKSRLDTGCRPLQGLPLRPSRSSGLRTNGPRTIVEFSYCEIPTFV